MEVHHLGRLLEDHFKQFLRHDDGLGLGDEGDDARVEHWLDRVVRLRLERQESLIGRHFDVGRLLLCEGCGERRGER